MSETLGLCSRLWKTNIRSHGFKLTLGLLGWGLYFKIDVDVPGVLSWVSSSGEATGFTQGDLVFASSILHRA